MTSRMDQDLRTALASTVAEARRYADREGFELSTVCLSHEATDAVLAALRAAPPRPVDAEREGLAADVLHYIQSSEDGLSRVPRQLLCRIEDVLRAGFDAHSPDKAVTREGVDVAVPVSALKKLRSAVNDEFLTAEEVILTVEDFFAEIDALAPKPTGTEAGRGVGDDEPDDLLWLRYQVLALCEDTEDKCAAAIEKGDLGVHEAGFQRGRKYEAKGIRRAIAEVVRGRLADRAATPTPPVSPTPDSTTKLRVTYKELIEAADDMLNSLPPHWHDDATVRLMDARDDAREAIQAAEQDDLYALDEPTPDSTGPAVIGNDYEPMTSTDAVRMWEMEQAAALTPSAPIAAPVRDDGKPMASAPKDREILLYGALGRDKTVRPGWYIGKWSEACGVWTAHALQLHATAWADLPPTPASDVPGEAQTQEGGQRSFVGYGDPGHIVSYPAPADRSEGGR